MTDELDIIDGEGRTVITIPIDRDVTKIGKLQSSHVRLEGDSVSRMHAVLERSADGVTIIDLGSSSGTFVNDEKINKVSLKNGDVILIGERRLRYRNAGAPLPLSSWREEPESVLDETKCPRCGSGLSEARWASGGAYRGGVALKFLRCGACAISVVSGDTIRARYDRDDAALGGDMLERDRRGSDRTCPQCPGELEHLTLSWASVWVEIEQCPRCAAVVLDDGEGGLLDALLKDQPSQTAR